MQNDGITMGQVRAMISSYKLKLRVLNRAIEELEVFERVQHSENMWDGLSIPRENPALPDD